MRLIDADTLKEVYRGNGTFTSAHFRTAIDEMPTIDTVPVVRCRDCKWFDEQELCNRHGFFYWT